MICISHKVWKIAFSFPFTIIAMIIYIYSIPESYSIEFKENFLRFPDALCFFYTLITSCLISFFMTNVVDSKLITVLYNKYSNYCLEIIYHK